MSQSMNPNTVLVVSLNTEDENAGQARNPISPRLAAIIDEENAKRAAMIRRIAKLNGKVV